MKRSQKFFRATFIFYCLAILVLSVLNIKGSGSLSETWLAGFRSDYLLHVLMFVPFMLLMHWGWSGATRGIKRFWVAAGLALAVASECVQWYLPYRTFNPFDLLANVAGIVLGGLIVWWGAKRQARGSTNFHRPWWK